MYGSSIKTKGRHLQTFKNSGNNIHESFLRINKPKNNNNNDHEICINKR